MDQHDNRPSDRLFPSTTSFFIFCSYISLFVSQGLLVIGVQSSQIPGFNAVVVVLLVEIVKLCVCLAIYLSRSQSGGCAALLHDVQTNKKLLVLYLVPALLYCLYNNLTFVNLLLFDVSTYYCLMQFRIVLTALIYQVLFKRQLTLSQWTALLILTTGCFIKEYSMYDHNIATSSQSVRQRESVDRKLVEERGNIKAEVRDTIMMDPVVKFLWSTSLLLLQMFCSCFAGVYNEYLLKDSSSAKNADIILQNIFMYVDSIVCNLIALVISSTYSGKEIIANDIGYLSTLRNLMSSPLVIILILNNAASGLVASFFLKSLNSILKTFASALELFAITFLAWLLLGDKVDLYTVIALVLVSVATFIYSKDPVSTAPPTKTVMVENREGYVRLPI